MSNKKDKLLARMKVAIIIVLSAMISIPIAILATSVIDYATANTRLVGKLTLAECIDYNEDTDTSTFVTDVTGDVYYLQGYYPMGVVLLGEDNAIIWYPYSDLKCYVEDGLG